MNFFNVFFIVCLIAPLFFFSDMARWQQIGYAIGAVTWLVNVLLVGSGLLGALAFIILFVSCVQLIVEHFPFRAG